MKKTLVVLAVVASMVATMACGGAGKFKSDIDSLSYAIGADLGLNIRFSVEDLDLDKAMVADNLKDFLKNGDIESEEFMQEMQQMQMFQYTKFMPYMQAAMMHERSERTDTLPALPERYDEEFKRQYYLYTHLSPAGYLFTAKLIDSYIDYIIRHNPDDFKNVAFIGTGIEYKAN